jgi:hypothetical protein
MEFPLYQTIVNKAKKSRELSRDEELSYFRAVGQLPKPKRDIICAIIIHHSYLSAPRGKPRTNKKMIPYDGKVMTGGKGVTFKFHLLPKPLQLLIITYLQEIMEF